MSHDCWYCSACKGYFDHGEECDCHNSELPFITVPDDYGKHERLIEEGPINE